MRFVVLVALLVGCAQEEVCVHDPPLGYTDDFGEVFMDKYCAGCHSSQYPDEHLNRNDAPGIVNLDTYGGVLEYAERIYIRTLQSENRPMPPGGGPTDEELLRFEEWMRCQVFPDAEVEEWW